MSGVVDAGDGLPLTVPRLLAARARARGEHPLVICDDQVLTYADAEARSAELAKGLVGWGAGRRTHVGLLEPNGPDFVVAWLAAARIGALTLPLSTFCTGTELAALLRGGDVEILIATTRYRTRDHLQTVCQAVPGLDVDRPPPLLAPSAPALRRVAFDTPAPGGHPGWSLRALVEAGAGTGDDVLAALEGCVTPSDRLAVIHTSGSTGEAKGVIHQHGPLIRHLANLNELRRYGEDEILFCNSPFFWVGGLAYGLLGTLVAGATLVCSNAPDPGGVLDLLERTRPTMCNGFAQAVAHLAEDPSFAGRDLRSIRRGNLYPIMDDEVRPADPELRHNMLGMTETGSVCLASGDESDQPAHRRGSFGRPVPGFDAQVVDPDTGAPCGPGRVGELRFRGPFLMEGYYGRERHRTFEPDGWYRTGDLCFVDDDGFFYFEGRRGDLIKTAGANVSPREVEAAILEETGLVAHVTGIDDPARGQVVAAAVRVPAGRAAPDPEELTRRLRARLSAYKVPRRLLLIPEDEVPMMSSGKLDARALEERLRDA